MHSQSLSWAVQPLISVGGPFGGGFLPHAEYLKRVASLLHMLQAHWRPRADLNYFESTGHPVWKSGWAISPQALYRIPTHQWEPDGSWWWKTNVCSSQFPSPFLSSGQAVSPDRRVRPPWKILNWCFSSIWKQKAGLSSLTSADRRPGEGHAGKRTHKWSKADKGFGFFSQASSRTIEWSWIVYLFERLLRRRFGGWLEVTTSLPHTQRGPLTFTRCFSQKWMAATIASWKI